MFLCLPFLLPPCSLRSRDGQGGAAKTIASIQSVVQPWVLRPPFIRHHAPPLPPVSATQCAIVPLNFTHILHSVTNKSFTLLEVWSYREVYAGENGGVC